MESNNKLPQETYSSDQPKEIYQLRKKICASRRSPFTQIKVKF